MTDMGPMPGPMDSMMNMSLLPVWVRAAWAVALVAVALVHVWHARSMAGQPRWWHIAHVLMSVGMLAMYADMHQRGLSWLIAVVFAAAAVALAVTIGALRGRERRLNPLWVATTIDMLAMVYMGVIMLPSVRGPATLTWAFVVYLTGQTLAWAGGLWDRVPALRPAAAGAAVRVGGECSNAPAAPTRPTVGLTAHVSIDIRISLAAMAASMAYMLAALAT
jgi:Domain of unknown function (DUF5134)